MTIFLPAPVNRVIEGYDDLVSQIALWSDDFDTGIDNEIISKFIGLTEARFNRELRTEDMLAEYALPFTTEVADLPNDFLEISRASVTDTHGRSLRSMSSSGLIESFGRRNGKPEAYAIEGHRMRIAPIQDSTVNFLYYARIPSLSSNNQDNWLLRRHPDAYLAGCMCYAEQFIDEPRLVAQWKSAWDQWIFEIKKDAGRNRYGIAPAPVGVKQVAGARC